MKIIYFSVTMLLLVFTSCKNTAQTNSSELVASNSIMEDIDGAKFKELIKQEDVVILDVRTPSETANGIIEGAIEIDINGPDFASKIQALDRDKTYLVYCRSGGRSHKAVTQMNELGFKKLYNLKGGYSNWEN